MAGLIIGKMNDEFRKRFDSIVINDIECFNYGKWWFHPTLLKSLGCIVIEYAESFEYAKRGLFVEDGDLFPLEEGFDKIIGYALEEIMAE